MIWNVKQKMAFVSLVGYFFLLNKFNEFILDDIHQGVNRLKLLALQMNEELESQKPITERLGKKIGTLNDEVNKKNKDVKSILLR